MAQRAAAAAAAAAASSEAGASEAAAEGGEPRLGAVGRNLPPGPSHTKAVDTHAHIGRARAHT